MGYSNTMKFVNVFSLESFPVYGKCTICDACRPCHSVLSILKGNYSEPVAFPHVLGSLNETLWADCDPSMQQSIGIVLIINVCYI